MQIQGEILGKKAKKVEGRRKAGHRWKETCDTNLWQSESGSFCSLWINLLVQLKLVHLYCVFTFWCFTCSLSMRSSSCVSAPRSKGSLSIILGQLVCYCIDNLCMPNVILVPKPCSHALCLLSLFFGCCLYVYIYINYIFLSLYIESNIYIYTRRFLVQCHGLILFSAVTTV